LISIDSLSLFFKLFFIRGRLRHDRHFTFKAVAGDTAVTLLTGRVGGALASPSAPLVSKGPWLQILVDSEWLAKLESDLACLQQPDGVIIFLSSF
jgi:suppressor of fused-like protein